MNQAPAQDEGGATGLRRTDRIANLAIAVLVMAVAVAAIVATRDFPATLLATDVGPARFPIIYAAALIVLCVALIAGTLRKPVVADAPRPAGDVPNFVAVGVGMGLTVVCMVAMAYVGYAISTVLYLSALMALMGRRHVLFNPLIAVAVTAIIYVTFSTGLSVPLPVGSLFE